MGPPQDERTLDARYAHRRACRAFLKAEKRALGVKAPQRARPSPSTGLERVLSILAETFEPGAVVTVRRIVETAGCSTTTAQRAKHHALAAGRWPYTAGQSYAGRPGASRPH